MTNIHHTIDYIELATRDLSATTAFYAAAFGWQFNDYGPEYAGIRGAGRRGRGRRHQRHRSGRAGPGGPLVLLYSDDLDATVEAVRQAGGTVTNGPYEFPGGRRFHFTDPGGNELGVWATA